jgi:hypothetical protein
MSVQDFIRTAAPSPDWLQKAWTGARQRGLDKLTSSDIDGEIHTIRANRTFEHGCNEFFSRMT